MIIHGLSECCYVFGGKLKPLPAAVSLSLSPKITAEFDKRIRGGSKGIKYIRQGYDGSIELGVMPRNFCQDIFGWESDDDGTMTESYFAANSMTEFSLIYTAKGQREILWACQAGQPEIKRKTDDKGIEVQTVSIPIYARRDTQRRIRSTNSNVNSTAYKTFFGFKGDVTNGN